MRMYELAYFLRFRLPVTYTFDQSQPLSHSVFGSGVCPASMCTTHSPCATSATVRFLHKYVRLFAEAKHRLQYKVCWGFEQLSHLPTRCFEIRVKGNLTNLEQIYCFIQLLIAWFNVKKQMLFDSKLYSESKRNTHLKCLMLYKTLFLKPFELFLFPTYPIPEVLQIWFWYKTIQVQPCNYEEI